MNSRQIIELLAGRQDQAVAYLSDLIAAPTANPPGDEFRAAAVLEKFFRRLGVPYEKREKTPGRTNIIGRLGSGRPRVAIVCHLDTVPAGDGWLTDPLKATLKDGRLYGRGAKDDKGPMASAMLAFELLKERPELQSGELLLIGVADEECGSAHGARWLVESDDIKSLDAAIVPDAGHNMSNMDIAEKGLLFLKITCHGRQAHGSRPATGVSAIYPMAELALWLRSWKMPGGENELFSPPTATRNVGVIHGGEAPNMVPGLCQMQVDMRYLPGTRREELLGSISNAICRLEEKYPGALFEVEVMTEDVPTAVAEDAPICRAMSEAIEAVTGRRPKPMGIGGATVAKQFLAVGVPAVNISPGDADTEHVANEYMPVKELTDFAAVLVICLQKLAGRS